jgi:hypothetical protein
VARKGTALGVRRGRRTAAAAAARAAADTAATGRDCVGARGSLPAFTGGAYTGTESRQSARYAITSMLAPLPAVPAGGAPWGLARRRPRPAAAGGARGEGCQGGVCVGLGPARSAREVYDSAESYCIHFDATDRTYPTLTLQFATPPKGSPAVAHALP